MYLNNEYQVKLDAFEGPLDLLLHLIKQYEIDIYDIPLVEITDQYTKYIHTMHYLELDIASEYLVMAATLIALKSQMLLPKQELPSDDEEYIEDPREELMKRLIEYRKYKEAAEKLKEKDSHQIFTRPPVSFDHIDKKQSMKRGQISIYDMIGALNKMFERKKWDAPLETRVTRIEIPIEQRMDDILKLLKNVDTRISFDQLFEYQSRSHIVVTFMALLELMKNNEVYCWQEESFDSLYIYRSKKQAFKYGGKSRGNH